MRLRIGGLIPAISANTPGRRAYDNSGVGRPRGGAESRKGDWPLLQKAAGNPRTLPPAFKRPPFISLGARPDSRSRRGVFGPCRDMRFMGRSRSPTLTQPRGPSGAERPERPARDFWRKSLNAQPELSHVVPIMPQCYGKRLLHGASGADSLPCLGGHIRPPTVL